jgi:Uma2 family endonuclease
MKNITSIPKVPSNALDVFRLLPKGTRAEVLNNVLYMSPSPFYEHQQLVTLLTGKLWAYVETGKSGILFVAPFDVYLEGQLSAVQPDILFISNKNKKILKDDGYAHGAPDLIIEILSKDEDRDRKLKKDIYEKEGVKEYFIIDPKAKMAECYILKNRKYEHSYSRKKYFQSNLLGCEFSF